MSTHKVLIPCSVTMFSLIYLPVGYFVFNLPFYSLSQLHFITLFIQSVISLQFDNTKLHDNLDLLLFDPPLSAVNKCRVFRLKTRLYHFSGLWQTLTQRNRVIGTSSNEKGVKPIIKLFDPYFPTDNGDESRTRNSITLYVIVNFLLTILPFCHVNFS